MERQKTVIKDVQGTALVLGDEVFVPTVIGRFAELRLKTITALNKGVVVTGDTSYSPEDVILKTN